MAPAPLARRRVAVTGIGVVSPLGIGTEENWTALVSGRSGIGRIEAFDPSSLPVQIAGEVRGFAAEDVVGKKDAKKMDRFIHFAVAASDMAMESSGLAIDDEIADDVGVIVGVGVGGLKTIEDAVLTFHESGWRKISPFFVPKLITNLAPGQIAIRHGARGINVAPASACSSGAHAIGDAFRQIRDGYLEAAICGGAEATITPVALSGFAAMRALSTRNDEPAKASRPFDADRDGFVMGEGAGILVLEEWDRARERGAEILAEVIGYGANGDAFHVTQPSPEGAGAAKCMRACLADAAISPDDVDYINAHGTSTAFNDANETTAIRAVFGSHANQVAVSSTKSMTGHLLGAAGGIEGVYSVLALSRGVLPPTINQENADPACDLDYVPNEARPSDARVALSNSYGFGGTNVSLAFRKG